MKRNRDIFKHGLPSEGDLVAGGNAGILGSRIFVNHAGIGKGLDFMAKNFSEPIQLEDIVEVSGLSRRGFLKAFRRNLGVNPGAVLRQARIEYAKRLLTERDLVLKQIAKQCGYRSENTFCVAFQRSVGMPPKKYQRQYLLEVCRHQRQDGARSATEGFAMSSDRGGDVRIRASRPHKNSKAPAVTKHFV